MTSPSPSDFLTFSRRLILSQPLRRLQPALVASPARPLSISASHYAKSKAAGNNHKLGGAQHTTDKRDNLDVQTEQASRAKESKAKGNDTSTSQSDRMGGAKRAKKENPEAPDTIGMQDEKGH